MKMNKKGFRSNFEINVEDKKTKTSYPDYKFWAYKREKQHAFLNSNYSKEELRSFSDKEIKEILEDNREEWDY